METRFVVITFLIIYILAQTNANCGKKPIVDGNCDQRIKGFTYETAENRCKKFRTKGCTVGRNYYRTRNECNSKCKGCINLGGFMNRDSEESEIDDSWKNGSEAGEVETISKRVLPKLVNRGLERKEIVDFLVASNQFMDMVAAFLYLLRSL
ncbi:uncharacterized protein LOC26526446 [Drosophila erecta]|uniref:BPTI/Kunitz inhibitor domain-containing protein n=1 Tax=Drosophila erecta TaxID=7220 RepID=A0A0Q5WG40_DROER|nr:uncharacterized protein LOC26526446 [Drosophila erecta]KQS70053.1 uncharacterized protein Dere_GG26622 [Drosophila erecta]